MIKITFHGHSCFEFEHRCTRFIIDPFLTGNPLATTTAERIQVDYILVTHAHNDHVGDTIAIAKRTGATVIANYEIATWLGFQGIKNHPLAIGGSHSFNFGKVKLTPALHGSTLIDEEKHEILTLGTAGGFLVYLDDKTIYHAGDTGLFLDMKLIGDQNEVDLAFLPIGDNFTMGPQDALLAAQWVRAKQVIPMHYDTFPIISQDAAEFVRELQRRKIRGTIMSSGDTIEFR